MKTDPDVKRLVRYQAVVDVLCVKNSFLKPEIYRALENEEPQFIGRVIKELDICHARSKKLGEGDVLLFYRSRDQMLTSVCSLDRIHHDVESYEEVIRLVGKRTVYSKDELINLVSHGPVMIILFLLHFELKNYITLPKLQKARIMVRAPQSVMEISGERYRQILKMGGLDERFTLH